MSKFEFTKDQKEVVDAMSEWYSNGKKNYFLFGGCAGTGKTTIASKLEKYLKGKPKVKYCAPTAKAARVLHNKGIPASTVHSLLYKTVTGVDPETKQLFYEFTLKDSSDIECDLIVVDEASMIPQDIWEDMLSFDIPIIAYGDHCQLPPINDSFNLMAEDRLDAKLETICRQAEDNEIIKLSTLIRKGVNIPFCKNKDFQKIHTREFDISTITEYDQILAGKNATRVWLNEKYRELVGKVGHPLRGDRMTFLKNSKDKTIINGQQIAIVTCSKVRNNFNIEYLDVDNPDAGVQSCLISSKLINNPINISKLKFEKGEYRPDLIFCDYSYCLSVHKFQGAEANKVLLYDSDQFGWWDSEFRRKFLYTSITRSRSFLTWVCN